VGAGIAGPRVAAAIAEGVKLLHIADRKAGLGLDPGPQPDFEGAVREGVKRPERQPRAGLGFGRVASHENGGLLALHRYDRGGEPDLDRRERGVGHGGSVASARGTMRQLGCAAAPRLMGRAQARGCDRYPVFLLLFPGETGLDRTRGAVGRAIPARAGTGRPRRRSRRVRWRRSPPPCGRRGRARGRRVPPGDRWALPSPRRGEAPARSPIRRAAG